MWRRVLAGVLIALVSSLSTVGFARAAADESCACIKASCCCRPKRTARAEGCHGGQRDLREANLRCHHSSDALRLTSAIGSLPPPPVVSPILRTTAARELSTAAPRDGFSRLHSPPPRPPSS